MGAFDEPRQDLERYRSRISSHKVRGLGPLVGVSSSVYLGLVSDLLLGYVLNQWGASIQEVARAPGGKPYLIGGSPQFSVSHSKGLVAVAVGSHRLGLDIEAKREFKGAELIASRFFSPLEYNAIKAGAAGQKSAGFLKLWTLKESYCKMLGASVFVGLKQATFGGQPTAKRFKKVFVGQDCFFEQLEGAEFVGSVCCEAEEEFTLKQVKLADVLQFYGGLEARE